MTQPSLPRRPQDKYDPASDHIVTAASCTTNCLAPVVRVVHEKLGIARGCITTIHNLTNTQTIVDAPNAKKADLRRARWGWGPAGHVVFFVRVLRASTVTKRLIGAIFPRSVSLLWAATAAAA